MDAIVQVPLNGQRLILKKVQVASKELQQLVELAKENRNQDILAKLVAARDRIRHLRQEYDALGRQFELRRAATGSLPLLVADYCLYHQYPQTARALEQEYGLEGLLDFELMQQLESVESKILAGDTDAVFRWCATNRIPLKKMASKLEYSVRKQQYLCLVQSGDRFAAIAYSRRHLARYAQYGELGQLAMALVVVPQELEWAELAALFRATFLELHGKKKPHLFELVCAGLSALKTRQCKFDPCSECPACCVKLATRVPYALHTVSRLPEDMVLLPSRQCIGYEQLRHSSDAVGILKPRVCDPKTKEIYYEAELERVFPT